MGNKVYKDKSSCAEKKCEFYKNRICVDPVEFRIKGDGDLCCRFHPDAELTRSKKAEIG